MSAETLAAIGAFLSGVGAVISAWFYVRWERKKWDEECNKRLEAFREGLHEMERDEKDS